MTKKNIEIIRPIDKTETIKTIAQINDNYYSKTAVTEFQRNKNGVWSLELKRAFILSLFKNSKIGDIKICDIGSSIKAAKLRGDKKSLEYFEKLAKDGYEYVSIDGNNRTKTIIEFLNGDFEIDFIFSDPRQAQEIRVNGDVESINEDYVNMFKLFSIDYTIYNDASIDECVQIFNETNDGVPLNKQQRRSANISENNTIIRGLDNKYNDLLALFLSDKGRYDSSTETRIAQLISIEMEINTGSDALDMLYKKDKFVDLMKAKKPRFIQIMNKFEDIIINSCGSFENFNDELLKKQKNKIPFYCLYFATKATLGKKVDEVKLVEWVLLNYTKWFNDERPILRATQDRLEPFKVFGRNCDTAYKQNNLYVFVQMKLKKAKFI